MQFNAKTALFLALVAACATCAEAADGDQVAPFFGFMGAMSALVFSCMGAAYGTAKSGVGIASMGVMRPELVMKSIVPVVMAGVLGIYGLIIAVIISTNSACACPSFDSPRRRPRSAPFGPHLTSFPAATIPRAQSTPSATPSSRATLTSPPAWRAASPASPRAWRLGSSATPGSAPTRSSPSSSPACFSFLSSPRRSRCTVSSSVSFSPPAAPPVPPDPSDGRANDGKGRRTARRESRIRRRPGSGIGNERERASATGANVKCTENDSQNARFTASMVYNSARRRRVGTRFVSQTGAKLTQTQSISALTSTRHTGHSTDADNHLSMHD